MSRAQTMWGDTLPVFTVMGDVQQASPLYQHDSISAEVLLIAPTLVEALRSSSRLYVRDYGPGNIANVSIRGSSASHTGMFWNGMPINSPSLGATDVSLISTELLSAASLSAGASSMLDGGVGMSGVLRLSSSPSRGKKSLRYLQSFTPELGASRSGLVFENGLSKVRWRAGLTRSKADNRFDYVDDSRGKEVIRSREGAGLERWGVSQDISMDLGPKSRVDLSAMYVAAHRDIAAPIGIPYRGEQQEDIQLRYLVAYHLDAEVIQHEIAFGGEQSKLLYTAPQAEVYSLVKTKREYARYAAQRAISEQEKIKLRLDYQGLEAELESGMSPRSEELGLFGEYERLWGEVWQFNIGARAQLFNGDWRPYTGSAVIKHQPVWAPRMSMQLSGAKTFRNPTLNDLYWPELGDVDLRPEHGWSQDASVDYQGRSWSLHLGVFRNRLQDLILWLPGAGGQHRPINIAESVAMGYTIDAEVQLSSQLELATSYTHTKSQVQRETDNQWQNQWQNQLYNPDHTARASLQYKGMMNQLSTHLAYSSATRSDYIDSSISLPAIYLWGLSYDRRLSQGSQATIGLRVDNLLDVNYEYIKDRPTPGRIIHLQLIFFFDEFE